MTEESFFTSIIIKEVDQGLINGVYRGDPENTETKVVEVVSAGKGYYNPDKDESAGMPFEVGDKLVVVSQGWIPIDCESHEPKIYRIEMNQVIKRAKSAIIG